jgi:Fic family protein
MNGRHDLDRLGLYRDHPEPMQIVSGPDYARKIYFEAPPSKQVEAEMETFLRWFSDTSPYGTHSLPIITRAGIAHLWFESIHPFEDGNGRIGRAIAEKALSQSLSPNPCMTVLANVLLKRRKEYYAALHAASRTLEITTWLEWFATVTLEAQQNTLLHIDFVIDKAKLLDQIRSQLNPRQEKVLLRMFREGPEGFKGGLSVANYKSITGATTPTTTRDLSNLVEMGALNKTGERKGTRYFLNLQRKSPLPPFSKGGEVS